MATSSATPLFVAFGWKLLGAGTVVFGIGPLVAPGMFCRSFGLPYQPEASGAAMAIRAVGWRDLVNGLGLLFDRNHARQWLWLRFAFDSGDVVTSLSSLRRGQSRKPLGLAAVALGATLFDAALLRLTK